MQELFSLMLEMEMNDENGFDCPTNTLMVSMKTNQLSSDLLSEVLIGHDM